MIVAILATLLTVVVGVRWWGYSIDGINDRVRETLKGDEWDSSRAYGTRGTDTEQVEPVALRSSRDLPRG
jgi:hypothetical protein